jgi:glutamine synthetase
MTLGHAIEALRANACFRAGFGEGFVNYYAHIKDAEIARSRKDGKGKPDEVTEWEQREYFDLF